MAMSQPFNQDNVTHEGISLVCNTLDKAVDDACRIHFRATRGKMTTGEAAAKLNEIYAEIKKAFMP